jgi:hypothetical protein
MPPPPAAGNSQGWTQLAPAAGPVLNAGVTPDGVPEDAGNGPDAKMDAPMEAPPPPPMTPETVITNNFYVSGSTNPNPNLFTNIDPTATITRNGAGYVIFRNGSFVTLSFLWTATNYDVIGYAVQFGSEKYFYYKAPSATGYTSGSGSLLMEVYSSVCSQGLPNTCYQTTLKLYAVTQTTDAGGTATLSSPAMIPVEIDCGGCL